MTSTSDFEATKMRRAAGRNPRGVFTTDPSGRRKLVHLYQGGTYGLRDIFELFALGESDLDVPGRVSLTLTKKEIAELKTMADAYSFDHDERFIEMCLDLYRFAIALPRDCHTFEANF
jgi:hypothetical protein